MIDVGVMGQPAFAPAVSRLKWPTAGGHDVAKLAADGDRGTAVTAMADSAREIIVRLFAERRIDGIIAMGGGAGTTIGTAAMRAFRLAFPKVMVSTLASSDVRGFVGVKDIVMIPAIVDISGLNRISRGVFTRAAAAVCAMVEARVPEGRRRPLITASMFGNTTKCVEAARAIVEAAGFEVLVFHAVGAGGQTMESLIEAGHIAGVLDVTLDRMGRRARRRGAVGRADAAGSRGADGHASGHRAGMPRYGQLLGAGYASGEVSRPPHLPAQRETNARPDRSRRERRTWDASLPEN